MMYVLKRTLAMAMHLACYLVVMEIWQPLRGYGSLQNLFIVVMYFVSLAAVIFVVRRVGAVRAAGQLKFEGFSFVPQAALRIVASILGIAALLGGGAFALMTLIVSPFASRGGPGEVILMLIVSAAIAAIGVPLLRFGTTGNLMKSRDVGSAAADARLLHLRRTTERHIADIERQTRRTKD